MSVVKLIKHQPTIVGGNTTISELTFNVPNHNSFNYNMQTPVSASPLPEHTEKENILIKIQGNSASSKISWKTKIYETSLSTGTFVDKNGNKSDVMEAKNIPSQINFFKEQFMPNSISDSYTLSINFNEPNSVIDTSNIIELKGTFSNFEITAEASSPTIYLCSVTFMEGSVQTITNNNSPFRVRDLEVTRNINNDTLDITWNAPLNFGNSTIKSYVLVYYKSGSSTHETETFLPSKFQTSLTVDPTKTYRVYLATVTTDDTVSASNEVFVPLQT